MAIKVAAFDLDGTIVHFNLDLDRIREEIGCQGRGILDYINSAESKGERRRALSVLEKHEFKSASESKLVDGVIELLDYLKSCGIKTAVVTRNTLNSVGIVARKFNLSFDFAVDRNMVEPKPSPKPIMLVAEKFKVNPKEILFVGDHKYDMVSGREAGAVTVLLLNDKSGEYAGLADYTIGSIVEVIGLIASLS